MFLLSWYCERFSPFSCTINLEEKLPSNYPSLLCVAERVAISSMPGHPRFPFHFLVSFDSRGRHSLFGGVYSRDCTFSNNSRTGSPRLLRAIVSAFKSHLVEKKKKKKRNVRISLSIKFHDQRKPTDGWKWLDFNRGFFSSRSLHHLVCLLPRYANGNRVYIGIRESEHTRDPLANEKATRFDDSYESSSSRLYWGRNNVDLALFVSVTTLSPSLFALFVSRYSCYLCRLEATFLESIQLFFVNIYLLKTRWIEVWNWVIVWVLSFFFFFFFFLVPFSPFPSSGGNRESPLDIY